MNDDNSKKNKRPAKSSPETMALQYQDRLNFWPDEFLEQANPFTRSSIFSISNRRKNFDKYFTVCVLGKGSVQYKGARLSVFDEEVFLTLLQYCRGQSLVKALDVDRSVLLNDLGLSKGGKNYKKLTASIERLESARLKISSPPILRRLENLLKNPKISKNAHPEFIEQLQDRYAKYSDAIYEALAADQEFSISIGFIQNAGINPSSGKYVINFDPLLILLFDGINTTRTKVFERKLLKSPAEIRLLSWVNSHRDTIYDAKITTIHAMLGSDTNLNNNSRLFASRLSEWLHSIEKIGRIQPGWSIKDDKVVGLVRIPYEQDLQPTPQE